MWITVYMGMGNKKGKTFINFKFSGKGKGGQNNMAWETLKNKNRVFLQIDPFLFEHMADLPLQVESSE